MSRGLMKKRQRKKRESVNLAGRPDGLRSWELAAVPLASKQASRQATTREEGGRAMEESCICLDD